MYKVTFTGSAAYVQVNGGLHLVQKPSIGLKRIGGQWCRVLTGLVQMGTRFIKVAYPFELASLTDRIMLAAQTVIKNIIPDRFCFRLRLGRAVDVALAWG